MMKTMKRSALLMAAVIVVFAMILACPERANAETVLDSGTSGDCQWEYYQNGSIYCLRFKGGENAKTADYTYYSPAPWHKYSDTVEAIYFDESEPVSGIGDYAFEGFSKVRQIDIYSARRIGFNAFRNCTDLSEISVYSAESGCVIESNAFSHCFPNLDHNPGITSYINLYYVTELENGAFSDCGHDSIYLGQALEKIGEYAFTRNQSLSWITIPATCQEIGAGAFDDCTMLTNVKVLGKNCEFYDGEDGIFYVDGKKSDILMLQGYPGSTTEKYAKDYGIKFSPIGSCGSYTIDLRSGSRTIKDDSWNRYAWRGFAGGLSEAGGWNQDYDYDLECEVCDFNYDHQFDIGIYYKEDEITFLKLPGLNGKKKLTVALTESMKDYEAENSYYESVTFLLEKYDNPLKVSGKKASVKYSKLKKKTQKLKVSKVLKFSNKGKGKLTYKKVSGNKKITINKTNGTVTIKKGLKKGTYKVRVKVKAAGNADYNAKTKTVTFKIVVKK